MSDDAHAREGRIYPGQDRRWIPATAPDHANGTWTADATTFIDDVAQAPGYPYLNLSDNSFCTGCGTHVWSHQCDRIETAQKLQADMAQTQQ